MKTWFQRYRHKKGFGVHSPFAFTFITEIVHQPYAYYAYPEIVEACCNGKRIHDAKLLHRIASRFPIKRATLFCDDKRGLEVALRLADSKLTIATSAGNCPNQIIFIDSSTHNRTADMFKALLDHEMNFLILRGIGNDSHLRNLFTELSESLHHGLVLEDYDLAIIVPTKRMPRMHYDVKL